MSLKSKKITLNLSPFEFVVLYQYLFQTDSGDDKLAKVCRKTFKQMEKFFDAETIELTNNFYEQIEPLRAKAKIK